MRLIFALLLYFSGVQAPVQPGSIALKSLDGKPYNILLQEGKTKVILFLSPECPLCQGYSLTIKNLYAQFKDVEFIGVVPGSDFTTTQVNAYIKEYKMPIRMLRDEQRMLVKKLGATVTPEAFVLSAGQVRYSGRIDNWAYAPGRKRSVITTHELHDALLAIQHNKPIAVTHTKAVGCYIE